MDEFMDALTDANRAQAIDHIKSMMSDKAYNLIDAQREAVAKSLFGDVVAAEPEAEPEPELEVEQPETKDSVIVRGDNLPIVDLRK